MQKPISIFLRIIGVGLLSVGLVAAYYGPLEIFVYYLFSKGGRFYYDGFGMGSLWFAALVVQNIGYYLIAALFIPVGIGYVKLRRWALTLTRLYTWFWLGVGILLVGNGVLLVPALIRLEPNRNILLSQLASVGSASFFLLILLPSLALWFYQNGKVKAVFEEHDVNRYWTERYPFPLLALLLLFVIMIIVLHVTIFLQGMFPMFGKLMLGRQPAYIIAFCILILGILMYGTVGLKIWAWWGSLVFVLLLTISVVMTFTQFRFYNMILMLNLPAYEMELINKMAVLHDFNVVGLLTVLLLAALGLVIYSKRYFVKNSV